MIKSEARKSEILQAAKAIGASKWDQETNAMFILGRVVTIMARNGITISKAAFDDLAQDVLCEGSGVYGNASQFGQVLFPKTAKEGAKAVDLSMLDSLASKYGIAMPAPAAPEPPKE